jgi:branched-chain amino acid transport system permease protein
MLPSGRFAARPQEDLAIVRTKSQWLLLAAGLIFAFTLVLWVPSAWQAWLIMAGIYTVAALGLHIMTGLCGQFSMGQAAFMAVGAYTSAILTTRYGLSPWLTCLCPACRPGSSGWSLPCPRRG